MFKHLAMVGVLAVLLAPSPAAAVTCALDDYQSYVTDFGGATGCTIGDKTFSGFTYSTSGDFGLPASSITVNPLAIGDVGFLFNAAWSVPPGTTLDSLLGYTVSVTSGSAIIKDLFLSCNCAAIGEAFAGVTETYTTGLGETGTLVVGSANGNTDSVIFQSPTTSVTVTKDISLSRAPIAGTSATISSVVNRFSQVPEPGTLSLFGLGLLGGVGAFRRRIKQKRAAKP